jgi:hypothetical protein
MDQIMNSANSEASKIFGYATRTLISSQKFNWTAAHKNIFTTFIKENNLTAASCKITSNSDIGSLLHTLGLDIYRDMRNDHGQLIDDIINTKVRRELQNRYKDVAKCIGNNTSDILQTQSDRRPNAASVEDVEDSGDKDNNRIITNSSISAVRTRSNNSIDDVGHENARSELANGGLSRGSIPLE